MSTDSSPTSLSYKDAGVDIDAGAKLVERIKPFAKATQGPEVISGLGGFAAAFAPTLSSLTEPVLVSATDGVGTKLKLAMQLSRHDTIGIDLVAMCANDLIVCGAKPLFFLDYFATGTLDVDTAATVIKGIADGCEQAGAALVGGETAEMPGMYQGSDYDLAGFCVGIVDKSAMIDGSTVAPGDALIGLASSGAHSNGYSLIRRILDQGNIDLQQMLGAHTLGEQLLAPTRIYVKSILSLIEQFSIKAIAHNTGGGLPENLPRVLPKGLQAVLDAESWPRPALFSWLQQQANIATDEMIRTFNCGIGMVICLPKDEVNDCLQALKALGENAYEIGTVQTMTNSKSFVLLNSPKEL